MVLAGEAAFGCSGQPVSLTGYRRFACPFPCNFPVSSVLSSHSSSIDRVAAVVRRQYPYLPPAHSRLQMPILALGTLSSA